MRKKPKTIDYYGCVFHYRFERRAKGLTIVYSLRRDRKIINELERSVPKKLQTKSDEQIAWEMFPGTIIDLFGVLEDSSSDIEELATQRRNLPLAMVWLLDREDIAQDHGWSAGSLADYDKIAEKLINRWGNKPLREIEPKESDRILKKDDEVSDSERTRCERLLQFICRREAFLGYLSEKENLWQFFSPSDLSRKRSRNSYINTNIENRDFTAGQYADAVKKCVERINQKDMDSRWYFASLLYLTMALDASELCGLSFASFRLLKNYPNRYVLIVKDTYQRRSGTKEGHCWLRQQDDAYRIRMVPCSDLVGVAFGSIYAKFLVKYGDSVKLEEYPLLCDRKNVCRRIDPEAFKENFREEFGELLSANRVMKPQKELKKDTIRSTSEIAKMIRRTVKANLLNAGCEEEEIRYFLGETPLTTAAKHYMDSGNEAELNRMGAIQDRWHSKLYPRIADYPVWEEGGNRRIWAWHNPTPGMIGDVKIRCTIPPAKTENAGDVILGLIAKHGVSYHAQLLKSDHKKGGEE